MTIDLENFTANCELKTFELKVLNKELTMNGKLTAAVSATMQIQATMAFNMQYTHGSTSFSISAKDIVATVDVTKIPLEIKLTVGDAALAAAYGGRTVQANMSGSAVGTLSFTDSVIKG